MYNLSCPLYIVLYISVQLLYVLLHMLYIVVPFYDDICTFYYTCYKYCWIGCDHYIPTILLGVLSVLHVSLKNVSLKVLYILKHIMYIPLNLLYCSVRQLCLLWQDSCIFYCGNCTFQQKYRTIHYSGLDQRYSNCPCRHTNCTGLYNEYMMLCPLLPLYWCRCMLSQYQTATTLLTDRSSYDDGPMQQLHQSGPYSTGRQIVHVRRCTLYSLEATVHFS